MSDETQTELNPAPEPNPRRVFARYDAETVTVYQAFTPAIVKYAAKHGTFGAGFGLHRMTWIKPSFGWMLHRSEYATAHNQEAIARITMTRAGFDALLDAAVLSTYNEPAHGSPERWGTALRRSPVRCQWDPDRDLRDRKRERRAIQIGIGAPFVPRYIHEWIVGVEDVTELAHQIRDAVRAGVKAAELPVVPIETYYPVAENVRLSLGCE